MIEFTIPGKPIAKARPRFARRGKFVKTYSSQETEEGKFIAQVLHQMENREPLTGPVRVVLFFMLPRPKNHYGTGRNAGKLKDSAPEFPVVKPDIDNCEKFVFDCLNNLVWKDDNQVIETRAIKRYSEDPRTVIRVEAA